METQAAPPVLQDESESEQARSQEVHSVQVSRPRELQEQEQLLSGPQCSQEEPQPQEPWVRERQPAQPVWVLRELPFRPPVSSREARLWASQQQVQQAPVA
jgi:hypothetical protein